MSLAADELNLRLQVGRVFRGSFLVAAVALREIATLPLGGRPSWLPPPG